MIRAEHAMPSVIFVPVDHDAATPLWRQLADELPAEFRSGKLQSGRVMPSETTLIHAHGIKTGGRRSASSAGSIPVRLRHLDTD